MDLLFSPAVVTVFLAVALVLVLGSLTLMAYSKLFIRASADEALVRTGKGGEIAITDNANHILDCKIAPIEHPNDLERSILAIPGVVGTGLFLGMADIVIVRDGDATEVLTR